MKTRIYYVSAPAGSGKTHRLEQYAATMASSGKRKILIAQPTKELIQQTASRISNLYPGVAVHTIYSCSSGDSVLPRIERHMAHAERSKGQVLLITHEALKRLPPAHRIHWDLIVDEIPAVFGCIPLKIVDTHRYLTDHLALEDLAAGISAVEIADGHEADVEALKRNDSDDELLEHFQRIATHLLDSNRTVMLETAAYQDLIEGRKTIGEVNFFSLLRSEFVAGFESVTFMGANALETELFILWGALDNVEFRQHPILSKGLRYDRHQNGRRLTIHYLFEQQWSISRSLVVSHATGLSLLESVGHYVQRFFEGQRFLWVANKSADLRMFNQNDRLPPVSHGLNKPHFMNCHAVASTIALVHDNASAKFLGMLGLTKQQVRTVICYQSEYQAIMRCSLRDPEAIAPVTIIVPSQDSAEWIASKFDNCLVSKLNTGLDWETRKAGRPKALRAMSGAERARKCRERKKLKAA